MTYTFECGPVPPFNAHLALKEASGSKTMKVLRIQNVPSEPKVSWLGPGELLVEIECSLEEANACLPPTNRTWSIDKKRQWRSLTIKFKAGPRLQRILTSEDLRRLVD